MKLKQFDLEAALRGEKVVNEEGNEISEIHYFKTDDSYRPVCAVLNGTSFWVTKEGKYIDNYPPYNLFMAPKTITYWMNIYMTFTNLITGKIYRNESDCASEAENAFSPAIKTISFEIEE